jgi:hypothetical protein
MLVCRVLQDKAGTLAQTYLHLHTLLAVEAVLVVTERMDLDLCQVMVVPDLVFIYQCLIQQFITAEEEEVQEPQQLDLEAQEVVHQEIILRPVTTAQLTLGAEAEETVVTMAVFLQEATEAQA